MSASRLAATAEALGRARRRYLVILGVAIVLAGLAWAVRLVPDEAHASGLAATAALDTRFEAVRDDTLRLPQEPGDLGDQVEGAQRRMREGVDVHLLVRRDGARCYGLWWNADMVRNGRLVASNRPCAAETFVASNRVNDFDRAGPIEQDPAAAYDWSNVVPEPIRLRFWFIPGVILLGGVGLSMLVRLSILAITKEPPAHWRRTAPSGGRRAARR